MLVLPVSQCVPVILMLEWDWSKNISVSDEVVSDCGFIASRSLAVIVVPTKATNNSLLWI